MKMKQPRTDYGQKGETGEKLPKGAASSDKTAGRKETLKAGVGIGEADKPGSHRTGEGRPSHHMGKHDGRLGEFNDGKSGEREVYTHKRIEHEQD